LRYGEQKGETKEMGNLISGENARLMAIQAPLTERFQVIKLVVSEFRELKLPIFFWNWGFEDLQEVVKVGDSWNLIPREKIDDDGIHWLLNNETPGIYIFERLLSPDPVTGVFSLSKIATLSNLAFKLMSAKTAQWGIFFEPYVELPLELSPLMPVVNLPFPTSVELEEIVAKFCQQITSAQASAPSMGTNFACGLATLQQQEKLILSLKGLPRGELEMVLPRLIQGKTWIEELTTAVLDYKKLKFRTQGIEFIAEPDVPKAVGLELLDEALSRCAALLKPEAANHKLSFPRGMLLWGIPGTGKSLSAKLAAKKIGVPLVAADWGGLRGSTAYESRKNLKEFLATCDVLGEEGLILYFDDFDKGFAGYDSDNDGGISRQLASKLLTWMQEHTSKVLVMATVNRLNFLPPELIRRFEENIFFVDLPHAGARYEIFKLHLAKYFPGLDFSEKDWRKLLAETHLLTPAEIGNLVKRTASEAFYQNVINNEREALHSADRLELKDQPLTITVKDLIEERYKFTPAAIRDEDQIVAIRNQAGFAKPSAAEDQTIWTRKPQSLFEDFLTVGKTDFNDS